MGDVVISAERLRVARGEIIVLQEVSFQISRGEKVALLGPNGVGKSSLIAVLATVLAPSSGTVHVFGKSLPHEAHLVRPSIGYLPEEAPLYAELTVHEYLRFIASLKAIPRRAQRERIAEVISLCTLDKVADALCSSLSRGLRQRVALAQALLSRPAVLLLDEPTVGLDVAHARAFTNLLAQHCSETTVVLTTHVFSELKDLCSRALVLQGGLLVSDGPLADLPQTVGDLERLFNGDSVMAQERLAPFGIRPL